VTTSTRHPRRARDPRRHRHPRVERAKGKTFRWAGRYDADLVGRVTLDTQLNVFADFQPKIGPSTATRPIVLLGNIHPALQIEVLDRCGTRVGGRRHDELLDLGRAREARGPAARSARAHHQRRGGARAVRHPQHPPRRRRDPRRGPQALIIKRGEHGALLFDETGIFAVPGFPLEEVIDPTGAGDSFAGGFIGYLAAHRGKIDPHVLRTAMLYGTATASRCVEGVGTSKVQTLVLGDVEARVVQIRTLFELPR
jgi:hypothetical protein